jgi:hypothetical protein
VLARLRVRVVDMSTVERSAADPLFAEGACDLVSECGVLGSEPFDLGSGGVEALSARLIGRALRAGDRSGAGGDAGAESRRWCLAPRGVLVADGGPPGVAEARATTTRMSYAWVRLFYALEAGAGLRDEVAGLVAELGPDAVLVTESPGGATIPA